MNNLKNRIDNKSKLMNNKVDELKEKENRIGEIIHLLKLQEGKFLTREQKAKLDDEGIRMEFKLTELLKECKLKEADIKINSLKAKLEIIKNNV